jgi:hypothetical protein
MIQEKLNSFGYKVFLDFETMRSGKFNEQIYEKIEMCNDVILICNPGCFDRAYNSEDWFRLEVLHAIKHKKNIIPVMLRGFEFPEVMPTELEEIPLLQGVRSSDELFDAFIDRLRSYLESRPSLILKKRKSLLITISVILIMTFGLIYFFESQRQREVEQVATTVVGDAGWRLGLLNVEMQNVKQLANEWDDFFSRTQFEAGYDYEGERERILSLIEKRKSNIQKYYDSDSLSTDMIKILAKSDIPLEDVRAMYGMSFEDCLEELKNYYDFVFLLVETKPNGWLPGFKKSVKLSSSMIEYSYNVYYYNVLTLIADMPESSHEVFNEQYPLLTEFPVVYEFSKADAERSAERYFKLYEEALYEYTELVGVQGRLIQDFEKQLEVVVAKNEYIDTYEKQIESKSKKLELQKQEIALKQVELAEMKNRIREKFKPTDTDDQGLLWGKMLRFLAVKLKPEALLALDFYEKKAGMEALPYTVPARNFIENQLFSSYQGGLVVMVFEDNRDHSVIEIGDIIVAIQDEQVIDFEDYQLIRKKYSDSPVLTVLRMDEEDNLVTLKLKSSPNDPKIGMLDLMEKLN